MYGEVSISVSQIWFENRWVLRWKCWVWFLISKICGKLWFSVLIGSASNASLKIHGGCASLNEFWTERFPQCESSILSAEEKECLGQPKKLKDEDLGLIDKDACQMAKALAETLELTQQAISKKPQISWYIQKKEN